MNPMNQLILKLCSKLRRDNPSKILMNLCAALGLLNLVFISLTHFRGEQHQILCKVCIVFSIKSSKCNDCLLAVSTNTWKYIYYLFVFLMVVQIWYLLFTFQRGCIGIMLYSYYCISAFSKAARTLYSTHQVIYYDLDLLIDKKESSHFSVHRYKYKPQIYFRSRVSYSTTFFQLPLHGWPQKLSTCTQPQFLYSLTSKDLC